MGASALSETVSVSGVVPLVGVTESQFVLENGVTVTLAGAPDVSTRVCEGVVTLDCVLKVI